MLNSSIFVNMKKTKKMIYSSNYEVQTNLIIENYLLYINFEIFCNYL